MTPNQLLSAIAAADPDTLAAIRELLKADPNMEQKQRQRAKTAERMRRYRARKSHQSGLLASSADLENMSGRQKEHYRYSALRRSQWLALFSAEHPDGVVPLAIDYRTGMPIVLRHPRPLWADKLLVDVKPLQWVCWTRAESTIESKEHHGLPKTIRWTLHQWLDALQWLCGGADALRDATAGCSVALPLSPEQRASLPYSLRKPGIWPEVGLMWSWIDSCAAWVRQNPQLTTWPPANITTHTENSSSVSASDSIF
jgi:hypothetical protein